MQERRWPRLKTFLRGTIYFNNRRSSVDCVVRDISDGGARLAVSDETMVPDTFEIHIPQKERAHIGDVKWRRGEEIGLQFQDPVGVVAPASYLAELSRRVKRLENEVAMLRRALGEIKTGTETGSI
jgi:hypothetical protein